MTEQFANLAQSTLSGNINAGATSLTIASSTTFPTIGNFRIIIDSEIFLVSVVSGNTLTVTPGYEGTTQASHTSGASVTHILTAGAAASFVQKNNQGGIIINGLGDSITAQTYYQPTGAANAPVWVHSTTYATGNQVSNNGNIYRCTTGGTSASISGPSGVGSSISDGSVTWTYMPPTANKYTTSYLKWAETFSEGRLFLDLRQGYNGAAGGFVKGFVINGGSGYTAPTLTLNGGATGTLTVIGGVITAVNIINPGYPNGTFTYNISDSTGSGAILSFPCGTNGLFAKTGNKTSDIVAMLPDAIASNVDIFVVHGGTNDVSNNISYSVIIANLRTCYEALVNAGKKVIAMPILPRTGLSALTLPVMLRVNRWIRAYCRKESWANPSGITNVVLADPTGYLTDGTSAYNAPVGSTGGVAYAMFQEGLHPSPRGAMYIGYTVWQAAQQFIGATPSYCARVYSSDDGYDFNNAPGGNLLEGQPWESYTAYSQYELCSNNGNIYVCITSGTAAGSGPSGTGTNITDGSVVWNYVMPARMSVFASGTAGTNNATTGISYSGNLASGFTMYRVQGSASGTITESIENPWSNNQAGQRQVITFSLGSGDHNELWELIVGPVSVYSALGIRPSDLGVTPFFAEAEIELSSVANLQAAFIYLTDVNGGFNAYDGYFGPEGGAGALGTQGMQMMASSGEMLAIPNNGKLSLRTPPLVLPPGLDYFTLLIRWIFDASGGAGSATATSKINYVSIRRYGVA